MNKIGWIGIMIVCVGIVSAFGITQISQAQPNSDLKSKIGACCITDGEGGFECFEVDPMSCFNGQGFYWGDSTVCSPSICDLPRGACCIEENCTIESESDCLDAGGLYLGDFYRCNLNGSTCS